MLKMAIYCIDQYIVRNGEYCSIAAKYGYFLGIMVISWSLLMVHKTIYDRFEHTHILVNMYTGLG